MPGPPDSTRPDTHTHCWDCGRFYLDAIGPYPPQDVLVRCCRQTRPANEHVDRIVEHAWQQHCDRARRDGRRLFNGALCRLVAFRGDREHLELTVGPTTYRDFLGTNLTHAHLRYVHGADVLADPIGVSAVLVSGDGFLLLGRRSERVAYHAGRVHPLGGLVEAPADPTSPPDLVAALRKHLRDETDLEPERMHATACLGLVRDKHTVQPELLFDLLAARDAEALRHAARRAVNADDHTQIVPVRDHPEAVAHFMQQHLGELTPLALAALLLHGLRHWGGGWFATTRGFLRSLI